jgi:hypothetical protein
MYLFVPLEHCVQCDSDFLSPMQESVCLCPFFHMLRVSLRLHLFSARLSVVWLNIPFVSSGEELPTFGGDCIASNLSNIKSNRNNHISFKHR